MEFRYDTSFPFLAIARRHGVAYGVVLMVAERVERETTTHPKGSLLLSQIADAVAREAERRKMLDPLRDKPHECLIWHDSPIGRL